MRVFDDSHDAHLARYAAELEGALLARALAGAGGLPDARARAMLQHWCHGTFNAAAQGLGLLAQGGGAMAWERDGSAGYRLIWLMPGGLACPLARLYEQEDGSWAALVVAGVKDDPAAAMVAAEWAVSRLTSD